MVKTRGRARKPAALKSVYSEYRRIANDPYYSTRRHLYNNFWDEINNKVEEELKPKKAKAKTTKVPTTDKRVKTLDELKQISELKDQIEALKARIARKDATIKSLKRQNEKLKNPVEKKKKEDHDKNFYVDNPDFLEIV